MKGGRKLLVVWRNITAAGKCWLKGSELHQAGKWRNIPSLGCSGMRAGGPLCTHFQAAALEWEEKGLARAISAYASVGMLLAASWALHKCHGKATSKVGLLGYAVHGCAALYCCVLTVGAFPSQNPASAGRAVLCWSSFQGWGIPVWRQNESKYVLSQGDFSLKVKKVNKSVFSY